MANTARVDMLLDVVGLGYICVDYLGVVPRLPTLDQGVPLASFARQSGGPASQALVALSRLGARVGFVGCVGDDDPGVYLRRGLQDEGVDVSHLRVQSGGVSPQTIVLVHQPTGKRSLCPYRGTLTGLSAEEIDLDYVRSARFLHLDGNWLDAALVAAQAAREAGVKVCLDAGVMRMKYQELIPLIDILIVSQPFAESAGDGDHRRGAARLKEQGPEIVVVTLGEEGSYTLADDGEFRIPAFKVEVVDTTGAGDVFHGAYLFGLLRDWPLPVVTEFASAVAALKCTRLGGRAGIPYYSEVVNFLRMQGERGARVQAKMG